MKLKVGDKVQVITGKDKGKTGQIIKLDKENHKVIVDGINVVTKHVKPSQSNPEGRIVKQPRAIHASNVLFFDGSVATKIGYKEENGNKVRIAKKTGKAIK